jgi:protein disulfide-isomerase A6
MFSTKGPTSPLWKSLAIEFQDRMTLAQVRDTQKKVVEEFNVEKFPTLIVLPGGLAAGIVYNGEMKPEPLLKFLSEFTAADEPKSDPTKPKSQDTEGIPVVFAKT